MKVTLDLESRSTVDLKKCGMYVYAEHPITDIMCMAFKVDDEEPLLWIPEKFKPILDWHTCNYLSDRGVEVLIEKADIIECHNSSFEQIMWREIMHKRYGFPDLPKEKLRCSAALASYYALPRALGQVCQALDLPQQKSQVGYKVMMKMCRVRKPRKGEDPNKIYWNEDSADFEKLCEYCMKDVDAEYALSESLYPLPEEELKIWQMDQEINSRGLYVDLDAVENLSERIDKEEKKLLLQCQMLTGGKITSTRQTAATLKWLFDEGVELDNLQKATVEGYLDTSKHVPSNVKKLLVTRQQLSKSSTSKFKAMKNMACNDSRLRGLFMYHGASTGRWTGKGVQPQNLPRDSYGDQEIKFILTCDDSEIDLFFESVMYTASKCLRGMLTAAPGKVLLAADFKAIEARVLAWMAGEEVILEAYHKGDCVYKRNAAKAFGIKYEDVTKEQRQVGKVMELSLGYQGWVKAFESMGVAYGIKMSEDRMKELILAWRDSRPNTLAFWQGVEAAAIKAVNNPGTAFSYGRTKFGVRGRFLHCRLPGGKLISYCDPSTKLRQDQFGREKLNLRYKSMGTDNKWVDTYSYGGKLTENIIQAVSRNILAEAMLRAEGKGFPTVLHCHDENVVEMPENNPRYEEFISLMEVVPSWAKGLPLDVDGWQSKRYHK